MASSKNIGMQQAGNIRKLNASLPAMFRVFAPLRQAVKLTTGITGLPGLFFLLTWSS
jgi:hypothetical protein